MSDTIKIKRGVDIKLQGEAEQVYANVDLPETFAVKPTDFAGVRSKLAVREGDEVKAGTPVLFNKDRDVVKFTSPVSGEVVEVVRGAKRKLLAVKILADKEIQYEDFGKANPSDLDAESIKSKMLASGCWPFIKQRPYDIVANPERTPKNIYISGFDSSPLAPDLNFVMHGMEEEFQAGLDALAKLTEGKIHLGLNAKSKPSSLFTQAKGVQLHYFKGPHPAGNVGTQIHHIDPINKGDVVWTTTPQEVAIIGRLFLTGKYQPTKNIAVAGGGVKKPRYYKTMVGASLKNILADNLAGDNLRVISGTVLTGDKVDPEGYLGYYHNMVSVIPEGTKDEFFGWIAPNFNKFSTHRTLFSWMQPNKRYNLDTHMNGEERAFVVTGEMEKVFPFDIYPMQLIKAIMIDDIEAMENLGIYEVSEEDFALCEVICTSKIPIQSRVRGGLDLMLKELGD